MGTLSLSSYFQLGGLPQRLVDVCWLAKLAVLGRVVRRPPALVLFSNVDCE